MDEPHGRDVFVAGPLTTGLCFAPLSATTIAAMFAEAFGLPAGRALTEDASFEQQLAAWDGDHVLVYRLEPGGDFPFKVAMDFYRSIEVERFAVMAQMHDVAIAYAVDERAANDFHYNVVDGAGTRVRLLSFDETASSYACNLVGGRHTGGGRGGA